MGADCYFHTADGEVMVIPSHLVKPAGSLRSFNIYGIEPETKECFVGITRNLGPLANYCGCYPTYDICEKQLHAQEAIPILEAALEKAKAMTKLRIRFVLNMAMMKHFEDISLDDCFNFKQSELAKERRYNEIIEEMRADKPVWGATKEDLIEIYELMLAWARYDLERNGGTGYFYLGSH